VSTEGPTVAVLGPGGVGGLLGALLDQAGVAVTLVAREETVATVARHGILVQSITFNGWRSRPRVVAQLDEEVDVLIVATKATTVHEALDRVRARPRLVLPLLNGLDHMPLLRRRFDDPDGGPQRVLAGAIRVETDRPKPGLVVHTSPFLRVDMACEDRRSQPAMRVFEAALNSAGVPTLVLDSEADVMWSKLVRLNALACATSAFDMLLGPILSTPELREELVGALNEGAAVARAEGADVKSAGPLADLERAHPSLGSSMARDITAGREPELDAIAGAVLRAAARHDMRCLTVERLVDLILRRTGLPAPHGLAPR
jgi:2-dehydropantoate 2-reductase